MNKKLIDSIKTFNTGSTVKKNNMQNLDYNSDELYIDFKENISIGNIFEIFIKEYFNFKNEYNKIAKLENYLDLGYIRFEENENGKTLLLDFFDGCKTMYSKDGYLVLALKEKNGIYSAEVTNEEVYDYKVKEELIDKNKIKSYINLFKKYKDLLDAYNFLKKEFIFGNGFNVLYIKIKGDVLNELKSMSISFGNAYMNKSDYVTFEIEMLNQHRILKEEITIDNKKIDPTPEIVTYLLNNVYLNKEYLPTLYKKQNSPKKYSSYDKINKNIDIIKKYHEEFTGNAKTLKKKK